MSFKIYNGYKLPQMTLSELTIFHKNVSNLMTQKRLNFFWTLFASNSALSVDLFTLGLSKEKEGILGKAEYDTYHRMKKCPEALDNWTAESIYFPMEDKIICMFYGVHYQELWESIPEVSFYGYWEGSRDERCSVKEWETRGNEWNQALPDSNSKPLFNGVRSSFTDNKPYLIVDWKTEVDEIVKLIPSLDQRVSNLTDEKSVKKLGLNKDQLKSKLILSIDRKMITKGEGL